MDVIMVGDGCRGVRRVRRGVLGWENDQKGYLGVRMCADTYVLCVYGRENSRYVVYGIGMRVRGQEWSGMGKYGRGRMQKGIQECRIKTKEKHTHIITPKCEFNHMPKHSRTNNHKSWLNNFVETAKTQRRTWERGRICLRDHLQTKYTWKQQEKTAHRAPKPHI